MAAQDLLFELNFLAADDKLLTKDMPFSYTWPQPEGKLATNHVYESARVP